MVLCKVLLRVFSLDSADRRVTNSEKCWYLFKCISSIFIIGSLNGYSLCWKMINIYPSLNPTIYLTDVVQMSYDYLQYFVDLIFVYKYGREICQEYFKNYDGIDKILDVTHCKEIQGRIFKLSSLLLVFWLLLAATDFYAWSLAYGLLTPVFYGLSYIFLLIKILTNLDFTLQTFNVEYRLRIIGDILQDCYGSFDDNAKIALIKDNLTDPVNNSHWFYCKGNSRAKETRSRVHPLGPPTNSSFKIKSLTRCYLLIVEQCTFINRMFGIRILLNSLSMLIDMVRLLNITVRYSIGTQRTTLDSGLLPAITTFVRFLICVAILTSLVYHCERVYSSTDRIVSVSDHILVNRNPDETLRSSVSELRGLVSSRPITFNVCNFFPLGYPYLVSTLSVVCTYTIILLQNI